jgi:RNA polymerase sigma-70 factor (ECF subfamily)
MAATQLGDTAAFEQLVDRYKNVVFTLALSMLRSREDAEEAAQDTFIKLFRARDGYDTTRPFEPWLLRIAGNACRDRLRRRRVQLAGAGFSADPIEQCQHIVDPGSVGRATRDAAHQEVRHALDQLSDKLRVPLMLKYLNGFTNRQISAALEISVSNVKLRLARAKDLLQARLVSVFEGGG